MSLQALSDTRGSVAVAVAWADTVTPLLPDEVQAIASMMEKQARIVVKPKEVSQEEKQRKAALLAQYANVTDEEEYPCLHCSGLGGTIPVLNLLKQQRPPSFAGPAGESWGSFAVFLHDKITSMDSFVECCEQMLLGRCLSPPTRGCDALPSSGVWQESSECPQPSAVGAEFLSCFPRRNLLK